MDSKSIGQTFTDLHARGQIGLIPFLPAGYPDLATTAALIPGLEAAGANVIEVGFPFSDPVADGPTIPPERRVEIAELSSGFVYYLSVSGITGERDRLPPDLIDNLRKLRKVTSRPLCVGFGISRAEHVAKLSAVADGVIVGSAYVK